MSEPTDLLFFDTFSHETSEELNLDLVQFPKSVFVSEIRIIPLGARVQGDFPGGVRLGATNPSQFHIDFFVNDLSKPGASTFETLGELDYCQNGTIHMECATSPEQPRIPTDGLVLRGWYTTITLAVYGQLTQTTPEASVISNPPPNVRPAITREVGPVPSSTGVPQGPEWEQEVPNPIPTYTGNMAVANPEMYGPTNSYPTDNYDPQMYRNDYYEEEPPKDPRTYHHMEEPSGDLWDKDRREISCEREPERVRISPNIDLDRERMRSLDHERRDTRSRIRSRSIDRDRGRSRDSSRHRDRSREHDRGPSRSRSHDRDYMMKGDYRPLSRSRSRSRARSRAHSDERDWDRSSYKKEDYRRHRDSSYDRSRAGSYDKRSTSYERRGSPFDKRATSYDRSYEKRAPSYEQPGSYEKRTPTYEKRLSPYDKRASSYERRGSSYEKQLPYDKRPYEKRHSPYSRVRDSNYDSRSPSRDDPRKRPRTPPGDISRRPHTPPRDGDNASPPHSVHSDDGDIEYDHNGKPIPKGEFYQGFRHKKPIRSPSAEPNSAPKMYIDQHHTSLVPIKVIDIQGSPKKTSMESPSLQEEERSMDAEPFEPILSDEDICDDFDGPPYMETDYDMSDYCDVDDIIKYYNPFKSEWIQYGNVNKPHLLSKSESDNLLHVLNASFAELCAVCPDLSKLYEVTKGTKKREIKFSYNTFTELDTPSKDEWVHQCEQLPTYVTNICKNSDIMLRIIQDHTKNEDAPDEFTELSNYLTTFCKIGLNFDYALAQTQPTSKIRHMKCGIRLAGALISHRNNGHVFTQLLSQGIDVPMLLLNMYSKDYMALSIRLMILKALDSCLSSRESVKRFLEEAKYPNFKKNKEENTLINGYQVLITIMQSNPLARIKFAVNALIKKLNTFELLEKMNTIITDFNHSAGENRPADTEMSEGDIEFIINALEEILHMYRSQSFNISQPKRFLPVSAQFDINKDCSNEILLTFFKTHRLLEVCVYLLTCPSTGNQPVLISPVHELISELVHTHEGLMYLYDNMTTCEVLFKCLMHPFGQQNPEEYIFGHDLNNYSDLQILGLELAYRLKTIFYVESILDLQAGKHDENELIDRLQALYCLRLGGVGILAVPNVLVMKENIQCLLEVFNNAKVKGKVDITAKQKSTAKSYAIDLIVSIVKFSADVPFLKKFGQQILNIANDQDRFEPSTLNLLQESIPYLKPLEKPNLLAGDDITECVEVLKMLIEVTPSLPGEMITCLRVLQHAGLSEYETRSGGPGETVCEDYVELKHRYNMLQLFSLDGTAHLVSILDKLCSHFDQPALHTETFASIRGLQVAQVMLPCLRLIDEMLAHVVRCRGSRFRDTTAAPILLRAYGIVKSYPTGCIGYRTADKAAQAAIKALLAYAQPGTDDATDGDSIRRGPWTTLCSEVISYTMTAPYTFVPGLLAFSELLPLPLPMQTRAPPTAQEISDVTNVRRMWSAHLHSLTNDLTDMIQTICVSSYRPVLHMLRRVCVQIADLAPNSAATVARAAVGAVVRELTPGKPATATAARVLGFLACLVSHAPVKTAVLHAMSGAVSKPSELASALSGVLSASYSSAEHSAARECAAHSLAGLCDAEITLSPSGGPLESMLSNSLPAKEALLALLEAAAECLQSPTRNCSVATSILRALFVITEHDYGFQQFRKTVSKRKEWFASFFAWIAECRNDERVECLSIYLELLRALRGTAEEGDEEGGVSRRASLTQAELADLVGYVPGDVEHVALKLENILKEKNADEEAITNAQIIAESLQRSAESEPPEIVIPELVLPLPDSLVAQFGARSIYIIGDPSDERLTKGYWLNVPSANSTEEDVHDGELVSCNITELANMEMAETGGAEELAAAVRRLLGSAESTAIRDHVPLPAAKQRFRDKRPFVTPARMRPGIELSSVGADTFRSRPPNTSRPPSLHVDDFVALEGRGAQPTGPTGYNKMSQVQQGSRGMRRGIGIGIPISDRGRFASATPQPSPHPPHYRHIRRGGRGAWEVGGPHFGHFTPNSQYMMGGMGWGGGRQRGHRHRFMH